MSVSGLCQICESAEAKHTCTNCGRVVCDEHWNSGADLCLVCVNDSDQPSGFQLDG